MVKVLYDHQTFSEQKYGGIPRYFAGLMNGIKQSPNFDYQLGALISNNHFLKGVKLPLDNSLMRPIFDAKPSRIYKWNKSYSKHLVKKGDYDVFHPTNYNPYFLKLVNKPFVLTVHDMTLEVLPEYFGADDPIPHYKKITCEAAESIIAISESTKTDLIDILGIPPKKIKVIHHGTEINAPLTTEEIPNLPENYILFVGLRGAYKNFFRFLNAAAELLDEFKELQIVCAGGGAFQTAEILAIERFGLQKRCTQMDVSDAQLNYLYQQAMVFAFPSLYEGFGYPLLEAFKAGCPIVASNTSCFPEVGGDAITPFNPYNVASIYNALKRIITDSDLCISQIQKGSERLKLFPIEKQVEQTLALYNEVAGVK
jgi:glycosyltransferase involved in cell wall biosynthesis